MPVPLIFIHIVHSMMSFKQYFTEAFKLTTQYHNVLNPSLWDGDALNSAVRLKLVEIAYAWAEFASLPKQVIKDIVLVGGNANFNYTQHSDLDIHILFTKKKYENCPDMVAEYFKDKKELWSNLHDISIHGHDVEVFALEIGSPTPSNQGCYSILHDDWIKRPKHEQVMPDSHEIQTKVEEYMTKIDSMISSHSSLEHFDKIKDKLRDMRVAGLKHAGEFSIENIVFKELRNRGYMDRISDYMTSKQDTKLSL